MQIVVSVIMLLLTLMIASFFEEPDVAGIGLVAGIPGAIFMFVLTYSAGWNMGQKDYNLVKYSYMRRFDHKGLVAGLYSQLPGFALAIGALLMQTVPQFSSSVAAAPAEPGWVAMSYQVLYMPFVPFLNLFSTVNLLRFVPLLILPLFPWWGYYNGFRFFSLWQRIVYKRDAKPKEGDSRLR